MTQRITLLCSATLVALVGLVGIAAAKPKVAITDIDGDKNGEVGDVIVAAIDADVALISSNEVNRKIRKLHLDEDLSDKDAAKLASALEVDALVQPKLEGKGANRTIHFQLYLHGKKAKGFTVQFANLKSDKFKQALHDKMIEKIGIDPADSADGDDKPAKGDKKKKKAKPAAEDDTADADDKPAKGDKKKKKAKPAAEDDADADGDDAKPKKKKKVAKSDDDSDDNDDGDVSVHARAGRGDSTAHMANRPAIRFDTGVSAATRSLKFNSRGGNFTDLGPQPYSNPIVPGARFELELFPLAFQNPLSAAAGLGLWFDYDRTLSLTLRSEATDGTSATAKADQQHYSVGAEYRLAVGSTAMAPTVTLGIGYGRRSFRAERGQLGDVTLDLPDVDYHMVQPILELRVPVASSVALFLGGRGMIVTSAGSIVTAAQYGQAKVFGFEGSAGLDILLGNRFAIRLEGELAQVGYTFTGGGMMSNNRDNDPGTQDVFGATDRSVGGSATLAVLY
jgi:hypothetical protein